MGREQEWGQLAGGEQVRWRMEEDGGGGEDGLGDEVEDGGGDDERLRIDGEDGGYCSDCGDQGGGEEEAECC